MTKRDLGLDVTKAVAMFLVVFVHVGVYAPKPNAFGTPAWLENLSMVASLPMFLMISGMFARRLFDELSVAKLLSRSFACLWPVLTVIVAVGPLLRMALGMAPVPPGGIVNYVFSVGWFFFCLVLCEAMTFAACYVSRGKAGRRVALLALGYVALWAVPFGMFHAVEMLPFFWFGTFALPRLRASRLCLAVGCVSLAAFLAVSFWVGGFLEAGLVFHTSSMGLLAFSWHGLVLMLGRILLGLAGAFGLMTFVCLAVARIPALGRLAVFGTQTMGIFFVHVFLLVIYYNCGGWCGGGTAGRLAIAAALFFVSHYVSLLTKRSRIVDAVLWNPLALRAVRQKGGAADGTK